MLRPIFFVFCADQDSGFVHCNKAMTFYCFQLLDNICCNFVFVYLPVANLFSILSWHQISYCLWYLISFGEQFVRIDKTFDFDNILEWKLLQLIPSNFTPVKSVQFQTCKVSAISPSTKPNIFACFEIVILEIANFECFPKSRR